MDCSCFLSSLVACLKYQQPIPEASEETTWTLSQHWKTLFLTSIHTYIKLLSSILREKRMHSILDFFQTWSISPGPLSVTLASYKKTKTPRPLPNSFDSSVKRCAKYMIIHSTLEKVFSCQSILYPKYSNSHIVSKLVLHYYEVKVIAVCKVSSFQYSLNPMKYLSKIPDLKLDQIYLKYIPDRYYWTCCNNWRSFTFFSKCKVSTLFYKKVETQKKVHLFYLGFEKNCIIVAFCLIDWKIPILNTDE